MKSNTTKVKQPTKKQLARQVMELKAQLAHGYYFASSNVKEARQECMQGSGVIVQLTALGGKPITEPFMVVDGLSDETILALQKDIARSYEQATALKPLEK